MKRFIVFLLILTLSLCGCSKGSDTSTPVTPGTFTPPENYASVVLITINPQFRLYLDINGQVLAVESVNDDAKAIADKITTGDLETVVDQIATTAKDGGFVTNTVTVEIQITEIKDKAVDTFALLEKAEASAIDSFQKMEIDVKVNASLSPEVSEEILPDATNPGGMPEDVPPAESVPETTAPSVDINNCAHSSYTSVVTAPTEKGEGYTTHTCTACGHSYEDSFTNPTGLVIQEGTFVFSRSGVATLYGKSGQVLKTYTGWDAARYKETQGATSSSLSPAPWYEAEREKIVTAIILDGVSPAYTDLWFLNCTNLVSCTIPDSITVIGKHMFEGCENLAGITIPDTVTKLDAYAFAYCSSITSITIPSSVKKIGDSAFAICSGLTEITIPSNVTDIGGYVFENCMNLETIILPKKLNSLGESAFYLCKKVKSLTIPEGITSLESRLFAQCLALESVSLPSTLRSIGFQAFDCCINLKTISVPKGVTRIDDSAFLNCRSLRQFTITANVKHIGKNPFQGCESLEFVDIDTKNTAFYFARNCIVEKATETLIFGIGACEIPFDVKIIGDNAFRSNQTITSITIPKGVTSIGSNIFAGCSNLVTVRFDGTKKQWDKVDVSYDWLAFSPNINFYCSE